MPLSLSLSLAPVIIIRIEHLVQAASLQGFPVFFLKQLLDSPKWKRRIYPCEKAGKKSLQMDGNAAIFFCEKRGNKKTYDRASLMAS